MRPRIFWPLMLMVTMGLLTIPAIQVHAQGVAENFDELRLLVRVGDRITVLDKAGREESGTIANLSPSALVLTVGGTARELRELDVRSITQRHQDSLTNGAAYGMVVGTATAGLLAGLFCDHDCGPSNVAVGMAVYGALGAGIGVGVDALIARQRTIYEAPPSSLTLGLTPMLGRGRKGARVTVTF